MTSLRRLHRQLDVDDVGAAQRIGDLVARAPRPADVEHDPQRVVAGHAHAADQQASTSPMPPIVSSFVRATPIASSVSCQQLLAAQGELTRAPAFGHHPAISASGHC
ncbi:MAG TPA: hypothetical protein VFH90_01250 [Candidatus Limnocylindria bacterium]|nr:hypothetical protein [Candidatus Limnocylindria bacterium]